MKTFSKIKDLFGDEQMKVMDPKINVFLMKVCIREKISLIKNGEKEEQRESLYNEQKYSFTYHDIADIN